MVSVATMPALVVERPDTIALQDVPRPEPGPGDVLIRVGAAGICGSDVELLRGNRPAPFVRYPIIPGHEWAGTVEETGTGVNRLRPGDIVVGEGFRSCGTCARCREGRTNLCLSWYAETGFTHPGAFAEYICVPAGLVHRLPPGAQLDAAALLEPAACVASGLMEANLRPGLSVAVLGGGTLGLLAVSLLRLTSPARLALIDVRPERLELGRELGSDETWNAHDGDPANSLGDSFDLVFEAAGHRDAASLAFNLARRGGTVVLEGIAGGSQVATNPDLVVLRHLTVQGVFGASRPAWTWVVDLFSRGSLDPRRLVTHRFPLHDHAAAIRTVTDPDAQALKVQLNPDHGGL
ncbi:MAG: alcohol dehydrogenase catalytic domain-containing protein [Chloroflexi bacterium]|nr:alcohol dehydrogenase catalytic domain-containing protein [Chloroflexota bacterium]